MVDIGKSMQGFLSFLKLKEVDLEKIENKVRNEFFIIKTFRTAGMPKNYLNTVVEDEFQVKQEQKAD